MRLLGHHSVLVAAILLTACKRGTQPVVRICDLVDCAANLIAEYSTPTGLGFPAPGHSGGAAITAQARILSA